MVSVTLTRLLLLLLLVLPCIAEAQFVNAGRRFAFGIPEGPDRQGGDRESRIFLTFLAQDSGCATVRGPSGFNARVDFIPGRQREIEIDRSYMQLFDLGKNSKGFIVESSQPIHLELHVLFDGAGESTQIFPMEMLDGNYILSGWSIWNDVQYGENNRAQFVVTAAEDNTVVTITTPLGLLPSVAPGTTFDVTLNAGECYMGKMDVTQDITRTTSHTLVSATKPVNVILANSCAYVPFGVQSCNMLLDNILPSKYFGTEFYLHPINRAVNNDQLVVTGEAQSFAVVLSDGSSYFTNNGRLTLFLDKPSQLISSEPVMVQMLTQGSTLAQLGYSDPTWVTALPIEMWDDTLVWYSPPTVAGMAPFTHYVTVMGPQSALPQIMLDNNQLNVMGTVNTIPSTSMFSMNVGVPEGVHRLKSPVPIFAIATGFKDFDGYSLLPGGTLPGLPRLQRPPALSLSFNNSEAAFFCRQFTSVLSNSVTLSAADEVVGLLAQIQYDPTTLRVVSATAGTMLQGLTGVIVRTNVPGTVEVEVNGTTPIVGNGTLIDVVFEVIGDVASSDLNGNVTLFNSRLCDNSREVSNTANFTISKEVEIASAKVWVNDFSGEQNTLVRTDLMISDLQADADVSTFDVLITFDRDFLELEQVLQAGGVTAGWTVSQVDASPVATRLTFTAQAGEVLRNGRIATLEFQTFLSDTLATSVTASASFTSERRCPLTVSAADTATTFRYQPLGCGDELFIKFLRGDDIFTRIAPNPARDNVTLTLRAETDLEIRLIDLMGREVASWKLEDSDIYRLAIPAGVPGGSYVLSARTANSASTFPLVIER
jgi:hypothetical protein